MKWINAADGPVTDWVHVMVDGVAYCISSSKDEIHYEGKEPADLFLLLNDDKHRWNLAEKASLVHQEHGDWKDKRSSKWNVHYNKKTVSMDWDGCVLTSQKGKAKANANAPRRTADNITIEVGDVEMEPGAKMSIKPREPGEPHESKEDKTHEKAPHVKAPHAKPSKKVHPDALDSDASASGSAKRAADNITIEVGDVEMGEGAKMSIKPREPGEPHETKQDKRHEKIPHAEPTSDDEPACTTVTHASWEANSARSRRIAESIDDMSSQMFNKPYNDLSPQQVREMLQKLHSRMYGSNEGPANPTESNNPQAPLAPGQSALGVRWMRSAADEIDDDDDDDAGAGDDDEPETPKSKSKSKSKSKPAPKSDSKGKGETDVDLGERAIKTLEKLIQHEEKEGESDAEPLAKALVILKKFVSEEKSEEDEDKPKSKPESKPKSKDEKVPDGIPVKVDLPIVKEEPAPGPIGVPPAPPGADTGIGNGIPEPVDKTTSLTGWTEVNSTGFHEGDSVWRRGMTGELVYTGDEPGRVIAIGGGKVIVDWGDSDGIPAEENPASLVKAESAEGEGSLFEIPGSTNLVSDEAVPEGPSPEADKTAIESIMSGLSIREMLDRKSSTRSNPRAIVHLATGKQGEFLASCADGRVLVKIGNDELFVWPFELRFSNDTGGFINE